MYVFKWNVNKCIIIQDGEWQRIVESSKVVFGSQSNDLSWLCLMIIILSSLHQETERKRYPEYCTIGGLYCPYKLIGPFWEVLKFVSIALQFLGFYTLARFSNVDHFYFTNFENNEWNPQMLDLCIKLWIGFNDSVVNTLEVSFWIISVVQLMGLAM